VEGLYQGDGSGCTQIDSLPLTVETAQLMWGSAPSAVAFDVVRGSCSPL
jgi:hypothetical protein